MQYSDICRRERNQSGKHKGERGRASQNRQEKENREKFRNGGKSEIGGERKSNSCSVVERLQSDENCTCTYGTAPRGQLARLWISFPRLVLPAVPFAPFRAFFVAPPPALRTRRSPGRSFLRSTGISSEKLSLRLTVHFLRLFFPNRPGARPSSPRTSLSNAD